ncbi:conserved exported hypothetical protein [uncultured Paludibacter sp.]|nr:conserved exported hypothetical protein [uncultured Paludibacter sp.]
MCSILSFINFMKIRFISLLIASLLVFMACGSKSNGNNKAGEIKTIDKKEKTTPLDTASYNKKLITLANGDTTGHWPVKNQPYPLDGAILPFKRIVAYYGNLYSKKMGALGEYAPKEMWEHLNAEIKLWEKADSLTPVQPALHYIAIVAQGAPGKDGKYRARMPESQIDSVLTIAKMGNAIVFLDIQVGLSTIQHELPTLEKYLKMPHVHLGIDPEFSMKNGSLPGKKIGTYDASDVNYASEYLAKLVKENNLPPKVLVVHRFTKGMLTNYQNIKLHPEVQIVINMDGWGEPELKKGTHRNYIFPQPVQFTGFKLFYKNDLKKPPYQMLTPQELLKLKPQPIYIQYQ